MTNFTTRTHRGATGRMPVQLSERESRQDRRPSLRIFAFSGLIVEDDESVRHYAGYKVAYDIDVAYREAMTDCYRFFPLTRGYDKHSIEIVEVPGVELVEVRR